MLGSNIVVVALLAMVSMLTGYIMISSHSGVFPEHFPECNCHCHCEIESIATPADNAEVSWAGRNKVEVTYPAFGITVNVYETLKILHDSQNWWTRKIATGVWEPHTLHFIYRMLKPDSYYIDFGTWIGPTVLFGASIAERTWGLEPNPFIFEELEHNVKLNPNLSSRMTLSNECIADKRENMSFAAPSKGISTGHLSKNGTVQVSCLTLKEYMEREGIPLDRVDLIKIDTEGAEVLILPTLIPLFRNREKKPAISLGIHRPFFQMFGGDEKEHLKVIKEFAMLYRYAYTTHEDAFLQLMDIPNWNVCPLCELFLTDTSM